MKKKDCIFCNIEKDKLVKIIQRNSSFIAFLDVAPVSPGHAIIIPNDYIVSFFDFPESKSKELMIFLKDIKKYLINDSIQTHIISESMMEELPEGPGTICTST